MDKPNLYRQCMKLYIKNMVCNRCILIVKNELEKFRYHVETIKLGEVEIRENLKEEDKLIHDNHLNTC